MAQANQWKITTFRIFKKVAKREYKFYINHQIKCKIRYLFILTFKTRTNLLAFEQASTTRMGHLLKRSKNCFKRLGFLEELRKEFSETAKLLECAHILLQLTSVAPSVTNATFGIIYCTMERGSILPSPNSRAYS